MLLWHWTSHLYVRWSIGPCNAKTVWIALRGNAQARWRCDDLYSVSGDGFLCREIYGFLHLQLGVAHNGSFVVTPMKHRLGTADTAIVTPGFLAKYFQCLPGWIQKTSLLPHPLIASAYSYLLSPPLAPQTKLPTPVTQTPPDGIRHHRHHSWQ